MVVGANYVISVKASETSDVYWVLVQISCFTNDVIKAGNVGTKILSQFTYLT